MWESVLRINKSRIRILEENQSVKGPNIEKRSQRGGRREPTEIGDEVSSHKERETFLMEFGKYFEIHEKFVAIIIDKCPPPHFASVGPQRPSQEQFSECKREKSDCNGFTRGKEAGSGHIRVLLSASLSVNRGR